MKLLILIQVCAVSVWCVQRKNITSQLENARARRSVNQETTTAEHFGLEPEEDLQIVDSMVMADGHKEVKYQETYRGLPIEGETVVIEQDEDGDYIDVYGRLVDKVSEDLGDKEPVLTKQQALQICLDDSGDTKEGVVFDEVSDCQLEIKVLGDKARYVYSLSYFVKKKHTSLTYLIDATDGQIISHWDSLNSVHNVDYRRLKYFNGEGGSIKSGRKYYDGTQFNIFVTVNSKGECVLENDHVKGYHVNNTPVDEIDDIIERALARNLTPYTYNCSAGFDDEVNGGFSALADTFYFSNIVYKMYKEWYGIEPMESTRNITNSALVTYKRKIEILAHVDYRYENAFWYNGVLAFGDGNSTFYPLTGLDVVSHELGHAVTGYHSGLIYSEWSGGINEAFSDIAGVTADYYFQTNDWMIGFEVTKKNESALRYMKSPTTDNVSIDNADHFCPGINVHFSSGVFNKVFYLLANRWNIRDAFEVFLIANRLYWHSNSDFNDGACGVMKAATDVKRSTDDVRECFQAVGVNPCHKSVEYSMNVFNLNENQSRTVQYELFDSTQIVVCLGHGNVKLKIEKYKDTLFTFESHTVNTSTCISEAVDGYTGVANVTLSSLDSVVTKKMLFVYDRNLLVSVVKNRLVTDEELNSGIIIELDIDRSNIIVKNGLAIVFHIKHSNPFDEVVYLKDIAKVEETNGFGEHQHTTNLEEGMETIVYSCYVKEGTSFLFLFYGQTAYPTADVIDVAYVLIPIYQFP